MAFFEPEQVVGYAGLIAYARVFAERGMPRHPIRAALSEGAANAEPAFDLSAVARALMDTEAHFLVPMQTGMQLLSCAKALPEAEQDRLLALFEAGTKMVYFHRSNVDVQDLARASAGLARRARLTPDDICGPDGTFDEEGDNPSGPHL